MEQGQGTRHRGRVMTCPPTPKDLHTQHNCLAYPYVAGEGWPQGTRLPCEASSTATSTWCHVSALPQKCQDAQRGLSHTLPALASSSSHVDRHPAMVDMGRWHPWPLPPPSVFPALPSRAQPGVEQQARSTDLEVQEFSVCGKPEEPPGSDREVTQWAGLHPDSRALLS